MPVYLFNKKVDLSQCLSILSVTGVKANGGTSQLQSVNLSNKHQPFLKLHAIWIFGILKGHPQVHPQLIDLKSQEAIYLMAVLDWVLLLSMRILRLKFNIWFYRGLNVLDCRTLWKLSRFLMHLIQDSTVWQNAMQVDCLWLDTEWVSINTILWKSLAHGSIFRCCTVVTINALTAFYLSCIVIDLITCHTLHVSIFSFEV